MMKTGKMLLRLLNDDDSRYLKKLPAYRLREVEDRATKIYLERVEYYGKDRIEELSEDGTYRDMSGIIIRINKEIKQRVTLPAEGLPEKRTLDDIALQYFWEKKEINSQNKDHIASLFPELKLKNGNKLHNQFRFYSSRSQRIYDQGNDKKNVTHLKHLLTAQKNLKNSDHIKTAENEIITFKKDAKDKSGQIL